MSVKNFRFKNLNGFGSDFASDPQNAPCEKVNFRTDGECLVDGTAISIAKFSNENFSVKLPDNVRKEALFYADTDAGEMILFAGDGDVYALNVSDPSDGFLPTGISYTGKISFANMNVNGEKFVMIADSDGTLYTYDGTNTTARAFDGGVIGIMQFFGRTVVLTKKKIYVSSTNYFLEFNAGGAQSFETDGNMIAENMAVFGNEIVIAGKRGLCRLVKSEYSDALSFRMLFVDCERILPETLVSCGDGINVLTDRGLLYYNGANVEFKNPEMRPYATDGVCGFVYGGEYYACVKVPENADKRRIIAFGNECLLYDLPIICTATSLDGKRVFTLSSAHGALCELGGKGSSPFPQKIFQTPNTDFGIHGRKVITALSVYTEKDLRLVLCADGKRRMYRITGGKGLRVIRPNVGGEIFSVKLIAEGNGNRITGLCAEVEY